jgi:hypothetical protein
MMQAARQAQPRDGGAPLPQQQAATVLAVQGPTCVLALGGQDVDPTTPTATTIAAIATHIPGLQPGQQVLATQAEPGGWLVIAAWPMAGQPGPYRFDPATGTLHVEAPRLQLAGVAQVELRCGDALVRLSLDGKVHILGAEVLSSAEGTHRIEGASIDLN